MINYTTGNIFDSDADCIFNTVNCEGFMGKGIAYQFKMRFPENNKNYVKYCREGKLKPGVLLPFEENGKTIINFPTKDKWRNPSLMQYIVDGLDTFVCILPDLHIKKAAIPPLGCGNGGLLWNDVKAVIEEKLKDCDVEIVLFEPASNLNNSIISDQKTVDDLLLLYVGKNLDKANSLRFQKTFYFSNYFFGDSIFRFSRGRYGPYSKELYKSADELGKYQKDNGLTNSKDTYNAIYQKICSKRVDAQYKKLTAAADKALAIVNGIEEDLLLEGSATALYLIKDEKVLSKNSIIRAFKEWSDDKAARFNEDEINKCLDKLEHLQIIQRNLFDEYEVLKP